MNLLLKNGTIVNEGEVFRGSIVIIGERISEIIRESDPQYNSRIDNALQKAEVMDLTGLHVFPGIIDSHVHFREPGDGVKGTIESESRAAVMGGVTSFMDMPNNSPAATTLQMLEDKFASAAKSSYANYSFYLGASNSNLEEIRHIPERDVCGVKVFMGSSTGNLLVDSGKALEDIFLVSPCLIAVHCEDNSIISSNLKDAAQKYRDNIPSLAHPLIRSRQACVSSSERAIALAQKYNSRLHILHITTKEEVQMLEDIINPDSWNFNDSHRRALITGEACPSYLWFCSKDYEHYGNLIKCNPAIKDEEDMLALRKALKDGVLKTVGSDHAPHLLSDKLKPYAQCPSGMPLVQYSLQMMLSLCKAGVFTLEDVADRMAHGPAKCFSLKDRGFIREGFYADLAIVDLEKASDSAENPQTKCRWSPFSEEGIVFHPEEGTDQMLPSFPCSVTHTIVNGCLVVNNGSITDEKRVKRLEFDR